MPRPKWWHMVHASKSEALLAVDLYNRPGRERRLEGFVVHMHIAWTYLLHAGFQRSGLDYRYWNARGTRVINVDGEPKTWDLAECAANRWQPQDPVRKNIEFFIGLRNKIEHRFEEAIVLATAGHAQAHLINFENELVGEFGPSESIADLLRFPVFLQTFTKHGENAMRMSQQQLPRRTSAYLTTFHSGLDADTRDDQRFEFRIRLVPWLASKTEADLAISFVREDELTDDEFEILSRLGRKGTVIVRERKRHDVHLDDMKPAEVVAAVAAEVPFEFEMHHFVRAWKHFEVRPPTNDPQSEMTDERYATYDRAHKDYLYRPAFVRKLIRTLQTATGFEDVCDLRAIPKPHQASDALPKVTAIASQSRANPASQQSKVSSSSQDSSRG